MPRKNCLFHQATFQVLDHHGQDYFCLTSVALRHAPARDTQPRPGHPHFKLRTTWVKLGNMKQLRIPGIFTILAFALVGCGSTETTSDEPQAPEAAEQAQPEQTPQADSMNQDPTAGVEYTLDQEYFFYGKTPGVVGKFELPSEPISEIEELREQVDAPEVIYITATIDNRQGAEGQRVQAISLFDEAGQQYEFTMAASHIDEWRGMLPQEPEHGNPENVGDYNTYIEVGNQYRHGADAGEVKQIVLLHEGTDLPEDITRVAAYTSGLASEPVAALPVDHPEAQYVDLDFEAPTN